MEVQHQGVKETFLQTVGGGEMDSWVERTHGKAAAGGQHGQSHICA